VPEIMFWYLLTSAINNLVAMQLLTCYLLLGHFKSVSAKLFLKTG